MTRTIRLLLITLVGLTGAGLLWAGRRQTPVPPLAYHEGRALEALAPVRVTREGRCASPLWSRDGRWIAYVFGDEARAGAASDRVLRVVSREGAYGRNLTNPGQVSGSRLLADVCLEWGGDRIFYATQDVFPPYPGRWIWSCDRQARGLRREVRVDGILRAWPSPDGAHLLLLRPREAPRRNDTTRGPVPPKLVLFDVALRSERVLAELPRGAGFVGGWASNRQVLVGDTPVDIAADVPELTPTIYSTPSAWSADAARHVSLYARPRSLAPREGPGDVSLHSRGRQPRLITKTGDALRPALSPDGRCAAYLRLLGLADQQGEPAWDYLSLWASATDEPHPGALLVDEVDPPDAGRADGWPAWSPAGDGILYLRAGDIWVVPVRWRGLTPEEKVARRLPLTVDEEAAYMTARLQQIGRGLMLYSQDYGLLPHDAPRIITTIMPYVRDPRAFHRPGDDSRPVFQWEPPRSLNLEELADPARTVIGRMDYHPAFRLLLFADGHVEAEERRR